MPSRACQAAAQAVRAHTPHADGRRGSGWSRARNAQPHGDVQPGVVQQVRCLRYARSENAVPAMRWDSTPDCVRPVAQAVAPRAAAEGVPRTQWPTIHALQASGDENSRDRDPAEPDW